MLLVLGIVVLLVVLVLPTYAAPPPKPPPPPVRPAHVGVSAEEHERRRQDAKFAGWTDGMNAWQRDIWENVWDQG